MRSRVYKGNFTEKSMKVTGISGDQVQTDPCKVENNEQHFTNWSEKRRGEHEKEIAAD